jgi:hypothetical protein
MYRMPLAKHFEVRSNGGQVLHVNQAKPLQWNSRE